MTAFVANTNVLELIGLKGKVDGTFINSATVTVTINGPDGDAIDGETWPLSMEYVEDSNGDYRAILVNGLPLEHKKKYKAIIDADGGPDRIGHWEFPFQPLTRTGLET